MAIFGRKYSKIFESYWLIFVIFCLLSLIFKKSTSLWENTKIAMWSKTQLHFFGYFWGKFYGFFETIFDILAVLLGGITKMGYASTKKYWKGFGLLVLTSHVIPSIEYHEIFILCGCARRVWARIIISTVLFGGGRILCQIVILQSWDTKRIII